MYENRKHFISIVTLYCYLLIVDNTNIFSIEVVRVFLYSIDCWKQVLPKSVEKSSNCILNVFLSRRHFYEADIQSSSLLCSISEEFSVDLRSIAFRNR